MLTQGWHAASKLPWAQLNVQKQAGCGDFPEHAGILVLVV
jgi:hypothetical protein